MGNPLDIFLIGTRVTYFVRTHRKHHDTDEIILVLQMRWVGLAHRSAAEDMLGGHEALVSIPSNMNPNNTRIIITQMETKTGRCLPCRGISFVF